MAEAPKHISRAWWLTPLLLLVLVWGAGHSSYILTSVANYVLPSLMAEGSSFKVERVEGSVFSHLAITGLQLASASDSTKIEVDSLSVTYRLWDAVGARLSDVSVSRIQATLRRRSTGDFVLPEWSSSGGGDTRFALKSLNIGSIQASIMQNDTTLVRLVDGGLKTGVIDVGPTIEMRVDTLWSRLFYPEKDYSGLLKAHMGLTADGDAEVAVAFSTELSHLGLAGHASYDSLSVQGVHAWSLEGMGDIHTADLEPFIPGLSRSEILTLEAHTLNRGDSTRFTGSLSTLTSGRMSVEGVSAAVSDSLIHTFSASFEQVNPGNTYAGSAVLSALNGTAGARLAGNELSSLQGRIHLNLTSGNLDTVKLEKAAIEVLLQENETKGKASVRSSAGRIEVTAELNEDPEAEGSSSFDARGTISTLNLSRSLASLPQTDLNARFSFSGLLQDGALDQAQGRIDFAASKWASCALESGQISANMNANRALIQTDLNLCAESPLSSRINILRPMGEWSLNSSSEVNGLRVSELMESADPLTLSVRVNAALDQAQKISGNAFIEDLVAASFRVDSVRTSFRGTPDRLNLDAEMAYGGGILKARAQILESERVTVESGSIEHVDLFAGMIQDSLASSVQTSDLSGTFSGEVVNQATSGGASQMSGRLVLNLSESSLNRQVFTAQATADVISDRISAILNLAGADSSRVDANVSMDLDSSALQATVTMVNFDPMLAGNLEGSASLHGVLEAKATLSDLMPFEATLTLDSTSVINDIAVRSMTVQAAGTPSDLTGTAALALERGDVRASYGISESKMDAELVVADADIAALLGLNSPSRLSANLTMSARSPEGTWDDIYMRVDTLGGEFEHVTMDRGRGSIFFSPTGLRLDSLQVTGSFGLIEASGYLPRGSSATEGQPSSADLIFNVDLNSDLSALSALREMESGFSGFKASGKFEGPRGAIRLASTFSLNNVAASSLNANAVEGRLLAELDDELGFSGAELVANLKLIELTPVLAERATISASYDGTELMATLDVHLSDNRDFSTRLSWLPVEQPDVIALLDLSATLDGSDWTLTGRPSFNLTDTQLLAPLVLSAGDQRIVAVSSRADGDIRNLITIQQVQIDPFADLMTYPDVGGVLSGTLTATTRADSLLLQGSLLGSLTAFKKPAGDLNVQFNYDGDATRVNAGLDNLKGESIRLTGSIPKLDSNGPVQIQLTAESYSIDWIRSLIDPDLVDDLKGSINGEVRITGTAQQPSWNGTVRLENGRIGIPELGKRKGMVVSEIQSQFLFEGETVRVDSLRARSGDGSMRGAGTIEIKDLKLGEYDLTLTANDFRAIDNADFFAVVSGQMTVGGTTDRPRVAGRITVNRGDFWLSDANRSDAFEPLALTDQDLATLQQRFGLRIAAEDTVSFDAYDVLAIENFTVRMERDTWIRSKSNPKMDIQLTGDLDVTKKPKNDPQVFGSITILPERSRIVQFGKRFELERGELTFNGPMDNPDLNMEASYTVPSRGSEAEEVIIRLIAQGSPTNLDVSFDSDPAMELADIVSYIATGRPAAASLQISGSQTDTYLQSAAGLAMGPVTDLIENLASSGLGLDVIEIEHTGISGLTLTAGKYISPKLYVSVSQPISLSSSAETTSSTSKNQTQVTLEYELVRQLLLSLVNRGTILRVNLRWQHAF